MRLVFSEPAARDLDGIINYIALDDPSAAQRVFYEIRDAAERLLEFPKLGRAGRLPGTRELSLPRIPYLIVYRVSPGFVTILAVFHGARDLATAFAARKQSLKP